MPMTGVPLKVALGYKKIGFWAFQKNNRQRATIFFLGKLVHARARYGRFRAFLHLIQPFKLLRSVL